MALPVTELLLRYQQISIGKTYHHVYRASCRVWHSCHFSGGNNLCAPRFAVKPPSNSANCFSLDSFLGLYYSCWGVLVNKRYLCAKASLDIPILQITYNGSLCLYPWKSTITSVNGRSGSAHPLVGLALSTITWHVHFLSCSSASTTNRHLTFLHHFVFRMNKWLFLYIASVFP